MNPVRRFFENAEEVLPGFTYYAIGVWAAAFLTPSFRSALVTGYEWVDYIVLLVLLAPSLVIWREELVASLRTVVR